MATSSNTFVFDTCHAQKRFCRTFHVRFTNSRLVQYLVSVVRFVSLYLASPFNSFVSQEYSMLFI